MSLSDKAKRQLLEQDEAIPLADLMDSDSQAESEYQVVEADKPKRKGKPKPQWELRIPSLLVISVILLCLGFGALVGIRSSSIEGQTVMVAPPAVEQAIQVNPNTVPGEGNVLIDRWMMINQTVGELVANSFVRVLSQDNTSGFYNVADMQGHLTIVPDTELGEAIDPPLDSVYPPLGPYSAALGKNQKLLVTAEWNGDMPPGTLVYAMGWRAENGTWIYEVSPDRVKIYYLPSIHLKWADGVILHSS